MDHYVRRKRISKNQLAPQNVFDSGCNDEKQRANQQAQDSTSSAHELRFDKTEPVKWTTDEKCHDRGSNNVDATRGRRSHGYTSNLCPRKHHEHNRGYRKELKAVAAATTVVSLDLKHLVEKALQ